MASEHNADTDTTPTAVRYRQVAPWLTAMCAVAIVVMAIVNATIATRPIELEVFVLVFSLGIGLDPAGLWSRVRGGG